MSAQPLRPIYDSTEGAIKQMIEGIERMICLHKRDDRAEAGEAPIIINLAIKKHFELQVRTLQNAPRDVNFKKI